MARPVFRLGLFQISRNIMFRVLTRPLVRWRDVFEGNHRVHARNVHDQCINNVIYGNFAEYLSQFLRAEFLFYLHLYYYIMCIDEMLIKTKALNRLLILVAVQPKYPPVCNKRFSISDLLIFVRTIYHSQKLIWTVQKDKADTSVTKFSHERLIA